MLAQHDIEAGRDDQRRARPGRGGRQPIEHQPAEQCRPEQGGVVHRHDEADRPARERGRHRDLRDAADQPDREQHRTGRGVVAAHRKGDALLAFAPGTLTAMRIEVYFRARRLIVSSRDPEAASVL